MASLHKTTDPSPNDNPENELNEFVEKLLNEMHKKFEDMSNNVNSRLDNLGNKIDDIEKSITTLIAEISEQNDPALDN
jgi:heat shock factor-binding protein 1